MKYTQIIVLLAFLSLPAQNDVKVYQTPSNCAVVVLWSLLPNGGNLHVSLPPRNITLHAMKHIKLTSKFSQVKKNNSLRLLQIYILPDPL